jgi:hypothetical protein
VWVPAWQFLQCAIELLQIAGAVPRRHVSVVIRRERDFATYDESTRPDFIKADAVVKTGLIDGLAEIQDVASLMPASWNQIATWLRTVDELRHAA